MSTINKEWLLKTIAELEEERDAVPGVVNVDAAMLLAAMKLALASLEAEKGAEPVAKVETVGVCWYADNGVPRKPAVGTELFAAPPAPVAMKDHQIRDLVNELRDIAVEYYGTQQLRERIAKTVRAAMLQGAEPVTTAYKLPMQPIVIDAHGTLRFKENPIVRALLDYATEHGYGLNEIALEEFDAEDQMQLAKLIGYSLSGYGTLSYVTDESYERAAAAAPQQEVK